MKREILNYRRGDSGCCPGHDRQIENQVVRQLKKKELCSEIRNDEFNQ